MSETLSYGFKKPEAGDLASSWMSDLEDDIDQLNSHDHDGSDSAPISIVSLTKYTSVITNAGWTNDGGGNFSKLITTPVQITEINNFHVQFYLTSNGTRIHPSLERVSANTFTIRTNEQVAITAVYI